MPKGKVAFSEWLRTGLIRICRVQFVLVAIYAVYTIASDATNLITPDLVLQRWGANAALLAGVGIAWYLAKNSAASSNYYRFLISAVVTLDIGLATFNIYTQRGMASRAVMLYALAIATSAVLLSSTALYLTATLSTAAYSLAAVKYFVDYFNEGYKAELYIEVGFYCAMFFVLAAVLSTLVRFGASNTKSTS